MRRYVVLAGVAVGFVVVAAGLAIAITPSEKRQIDNFGVSTLKGLEAVSVTVKIVRDRPETLRLLTEQDLAGQVELALQDAGVRISPPTPAVGLYVVVVNVARAGPDGTICAINVQSALLQIAHLARDTTIRTEAQTWPAAGQSRFGLVNLAVAHRAIKQTVKDQTKDFAGDWRAANPK